MSGDFLQPGDGWQTPSPVWKLLENAFSKGLGDERAKTELNSSGRRCFFNDIRVPAYGFSARGESEKSSRGARESQPEVHTFGES
jgi:hypothetical protein